MPDASQCLPVWASAVLLMFFVEGAHGQSAANRVSTLLDANAATKRSFWGVQVVDLGSGTTVFSREAQKLFTPASNMKLFSSALALSRLGPNYRFATRLTADERPDEQGRVRLIRLIGGGDPNLSGRVIPYQRGAKKANPLETIEALADAAIAQGVRFVDGDIIGDDTAYLWEPNPESWAVEDLTWEYGAAVSALSVNDNSVQLAVSPGYVPGDPAQVALTPPLEYIVVQNQTATLPPIAAGAPKLSNRIAAHRVPGSGEVIVSGQLSLGAARHVEFLAIEDPALFAAHALREALLRRGVRISGSVRAEHRFDLNAVTRTIAEFEIATHRSAPLIEALKIVNKESQNLHAEILMREVARMVNGVGSREGGLAELSRFLSSAGIQPDQYYFEDASGLSRKALVTPAAVTRLLAFMDQQPMRDLWVDTLPVGGVDGTLENRFGGTPTPQVRAKTGTVSHVSTLSGYLLPANGRRYAFSVMTNNYNSPSADVRKLIDRIPLEFLREFDRR